MVIGQQGIDLIKGFEGFREHPYNDQAGNSTVGYGTLLHHGPVDPSNPIDAKYISLGITPFEAERKLLAHVQEEVAPLISKYIKVELKQCQYDALACFLYNNGLKGLYNYDKVTGKPDFTKPTHLCQDINQMQFDKIRHDLMMFIYAGGSPRTGLINRREAEADLWESC